MSWVEDVVCLLGKVNKKIFCLGKVNKKVFRLSFL